MHMTDAIADVGARMNLHKGLAESALSTKLLAHVGNDIWYATEISPWIT